MRFKLKVECQRLQTASLFNSSFIHPSELFQINIRCQVAIFELILTNTFLLAASQAGRWVVWLWYNDNFNISFFRDNFAFMCKKLNLEEQTSDILEQLGVGSSSKISYQDFLRFRAQVGILFHFLFHMLQLFFLTLNLVLIPTDIDLNHMTISMSIAGLKMDDELTLI